MLDLLKADLKRVIKDKLTLILGIIAVAFALTTPLIYKLVFSLINLEDMAGMGMEMLKMQLTAKSMFFSAFSPGNNFGLILPILVAIILCKDFNQGTVRNKIISGKSRTQIYFSLLITCTICTCAFILAQALLTLLCSLIFFEYQASAFTFSDFGYLMASIGFELIIYIFICALLTFFIVFMKNAGLAIVAYFVVNFVMIIFGAITQTVVTFVEPNTVTHSILQFLNTANAFTTLTIGSTTSYNLTDILALVLPNVAFTALLVPFGLLVFKKKDLK